MSHAEWIRVTAQPPALLTEVLVYFTGVSAFDVAMLIEDEDAFAGQEPRGSAWWRCSIEDYADCDPEYWMPLPPPPGAPPASQEAP